MRTDRHPSSKYRRQIISSSRSERLGAVFVIPFNGGEPKKFLDIPQAVFRVTKERSFHVRMPFFKWLAYNQGPVLSEGQDLKKKMKEKKKTGPPVTSGNCEYRR